MEYNIPTHIFIVPYRNRIEHKFFFQRQMMFLLEDRLPLSYEIYFANQHDTRPFNRGGMKNIGFLAMKRKYPNDYKNITFIFNDIDTLPFHKIFPYETTPGVVAHYYGFETALGGIVVVKGNDFETINGYPNFWGWGMEDACLQQRVHKAGMSIDRSHFQPIGSPKILQLFDGIARLVNKRDTVRSNQDANGDGISTIHNLLYTIESKSRCNGDNQYSTEDSHFHYINVLNFSTLIRFSSNKYHTYDLRTAPSEVANPRNPQYKKRLETEDWKKIPFCKTTLPMSDRENEKRFFFR